jgi:hypothetical protein
LSRYCNENLLTLVNSSSGFVLILFFFACNNDVASVSFGRAVVTVSGHRLSADDDMRSRILIATGDLVNSAAAASAAEPTALSLAFADELFNYTLQLRKGRSADICR